MAYGPMYGATKMAVQDKYKNKSLSHGPTGQPPRSGKYGNRLDWTMDPKKVARQHISTGGIPSGWQSPAQIPGVGTAQAPTPPTQQGDLGISPIGSTAPGELPPMGGGKKVPMSGGQVQPPERKGSYVKEQKPPVAFQQPQQYTPEPQRPTDPDTGKDVLIPGWEGEQYTDEEIRDMLEANRTGRTEVIDPFPDYEKAEGYGEPGMPQIVPTPGLGGGEIAEGSGGARGAVDEQTAQDVIDEYLGMVFGDEASFDPQRELMEEERDRAMRQAMERMAAQGMLGTGAAGGAAQDILRGSARDMAAARQDWYQQQVTNAQNAASMMFQDSWRRLDREHQTAMANLMFELDMKRKYGDQWQSGMGDYQMQLLMDMFHSDQLTDKEKYLYMEMMRELFPDLDEMLGGYREKQARDQQEMDDEELVDWWERATRR